MSLLPTSVSFTGPKFSAVSQSLREALINNNGRFSPSERLSLQDFPIPPVNQRYKKRSPFLFSFSPAYTTRTETQCKAPGFEVPYPGKLPTGGDSGPYANRQRQTRARGAAGWALRPSAGARPSRAAGSRARPAEPGARRSGIRALCRSGKANREAARQEGTRRLGGQRPALRSPRSCSLHRAASRCSRSSPSPGGTRH